MKNPLNAQSNNRAQPQERVKLTSRECLKAFRAGNTDRYSLLSKPIDSTARVWSMCQENRLLALAGWWSLPWDSQVLGCPSGSIGGLWAEGDYSAQYHRLETVLKACITDAEDHGVRFLSVRLPEGALAGLHAVEAVGFRVIESFLTFGRKTAGEIPPIRSACSQNGETRDGGSDFQVRLAHPEEMETVAAIAYRAFQSFRWRVDPQIPESRARHSRREWVRNGFKGRAEAIYVAENESGPVGFALLRSKMSTEKIGEIELIAVDPALHGRGIGKGLVAAAIRHYQGKTSEIHVGTQAKNLQAIGLYTRMGFSVIRSELSFHRHTEPIA